MARQLMDFKKLGCLVSISNIDFYILVIEVIISYYYFCLHKITVLIGNFKLIKIFDKIELIMIPLIFTCWE